VIDRNILPERAPRHVVYFYPSSVELTRTVARFVADGFVQQQPAFVVARPRLARDLVLALGGAGIDAAEAEREGRLFLFDADVTLESILVDGRLDATVARHLIRDMFSRLPEALSVGPARVFGEMCGMLWHSGQYVDAMRLEDLDGLWNTRTALTTVCSYSLEQSERSAQDAICTFHTHRLSSGGELEPIS
jgi:hypothetical protein